MNSTVFYIALTIAYLIVVIDIIRHYKKRLELKDEELTDVRSRLWRCKDDCISKDKLMKNAINQASIYKKKTKDLIVENHRLNQVITQNKNETI